MTRRLLALLPLLACLGAAPAPPPTLHWVLAWASAQLPVEGSNALPAEALRDATLRQVVRLTADGETIRVRLSNAFGTAPLTIDAAAVAAAGEEPGSTRGTPLRLSFAGAAAAIIPAGAELLSDPLTFQARRGTRLAVTIHYTQAPQRQTGHTGSRATSFLAPGNALDAPRLPGATRIEHWYQLSGVEVAGGARASTVVTLGDSITDGNGATTDRDDRWPDRLAERIARSGRRIAVANAGIGGNRLLLDGTGPNALARFDRDVLGAAGVRTLILLEGINDLGTTTQARPLSAAEHEALVASIIAAYRQIAERAHAHGIRVVGGTLTPFVGFPNYHPDAAAEADRQAINAWIRAPGHFDAVADFDRAARDPAHPGRLLPAFDSGDHIHPSPAGYAAMAAAIPLAALAR